MIKAKDNPFASERVLCLIRYRPVDFTWPQLMARLEALRYRAAIVGPHGTGKTTLLEDLVPRLETNGWRCRFVRLSAEIRSIDFGALDRLAAADMILLDGAEQLPAHAWWQFRLRTRHASGMIITSHRAGRLPTLLTTAGSSGVLRELIERLSPAAAGSIDADRLLARCNGDMRRALRTLYDEFASLGKPDVP